MGAPSHLTMLWISMASEGSPGGLKGPGRRASRALENCPVCRFLFKSSSGT